MVLPGFNKELYEEAVVMGGDEVMTLRPEGLGTHTHSLWIDQGYRKKQGDRL